jgi:hypothetical protein
MISGGLFAFATSFDEVVVTLFLAGPEQSDVATSDVRRYSREYQPDHRCGSDHPHRAVDADADHPRMAATAQPNACAATRR